MQTHDRFIRSTTLIVAVITLCFCLIESVSADTFDSQLPETDRVWLGPDYWAGPLQDWRLRDGWIECETGGGDRNVFLLTQELIAGKGAFEMSVVIDRLPKDSVILDNGLVGFKVGVRGEFKDYRDSAVRGIGFPVGVDTKGGLFIGKPMKSGATVPVSDKVLKLVLTGKPAGKTFALTLSVFDAFGNLLSSAERNDIDPDWATGGVALLCSHGEYKEVSAKRPSIDDGNWGTRQGTARGGNVRFRFASWRLSGDRVRSHPEREFGPILFSQYTLSCGTLKMTAQLPPLSDRDATSACLDILTAGNWKTVSEAAIHPLARTATFRVDNWDSTVDTPYRISCTFIGKENIVRTAYRTGTVRREPWDKEEISVAGFTGNNDLGFPNTDIFRSICYNDPDFLFFSGDQIYEGVAGFGVQREPLDKSALDYLRKWYLYGWAYGELMRDRPTVAIPDDHDVYHGNVWGNGGAHAPKRPTDKESQDLGGYKQPAEWVRMVDRTQASHLPDPYDPSPVEQGIGVYYTSIDYAGVSFAVLEDRKFKSPPAVLVPAGKIVNGWSENKDFDPKTEADVPGAILLGQRQLDFLADWAADWRNGVWMKVCLSQTIFANVATLPYKELMSDVVVPQLRILEKGDYPPDDVPVADMDSNGWPQSGRNRALRELRKGFVFHLAGDQHLGSFTHYGIDDWHDAGYAFCVPAISNIFPRRWCPRETGRNRKRGTPKYTGDFEDGFGNHISVYAVSNPEFTGLKPSRLYDRATGYGIIRLNRESREITSECWPRLSDPASGNGEYEGWPITIKQIDNYGRDAKAHLPEIVVNGMEDPVIQVIDESSGEIIYTLRIKGQSFTPKVFAKGSYTVKVGEPGTSKWKIFEGVKSGAKKKIEVAF